MHYPPYSRTQTGFTLVELSIVLVIIGLLLGGIIIGKDMIRAAQLRSVVTDVQGYLAASMMFQDKYNCLPGDCVNITTFLSGTTNGNGDGQLNTASTAGNAGEIFGVWQQLARAGYIKGSFSGVSGPGGLVDSLINMNVPASRITGAGYTWYYYGTYSGNANWYDGYYGNIIYMGAKTSNSYTNAVTLTPQEAYQIDQKMDDGIPGTGMIRQYTSANSANDANCNTGTNTAGSSSIYNLTYSGVACRLVILSGW